MHSWTELTKLTGGSKFSIERVRLADTGIAIDGQFDLPPLAQLTEEDQVFVCAFVRCHGSIKQMEKFFGVSYPTIKNRLNRIGAMLPFAELEPEPTPQASSDWLGKLDRGEATVKDVLEALRNKKGSQE